MKYSNKFLLDNGISYYLNYICFEIDKTNFDKFDATSTDGDNFTSFRKYRIKKFSFKNEELNNFGIF